MKYKIGRNTFLIMIESKEIITRIKINSLKKKNPNEMQQFTANFSLSYQEQKINSPNYQETKFLKCSARNEP